ncbi:hypothetical protein GCM10011519_07270 [Marmoricola endophyticus]|uniref:PASTA domain-containing protein n=1 Tax=Marmoricola endophyticus TaxID=2040280 RepID=A0A917BDH8_9ACTN|nr:PASTA domain-containing protein [Marmoricola endophyticus]GGF36316.1 hypothetical protein GCM10011519_07270 [Marmoricola endophyticus]
MNDNASRPGPRAGWWIDPADGNQLRYWNGQAWSEFVLPKPTWWGAPSAVASPDVASRGGDPGVPWWQAWWFIIPTLVICLPVGLIGLWRRPRLSTGTRVTVTAATLVLVIGAALLSPDAADDGADRVEAETISDSTATSSPTVVPKAVVPDVVGASRARASRELEKAGLTVASVRRVPSAEPRGTVLRQGAEPGASLALKTGVALVLAAPLPLVPAVVGELGQQARASLRAAGFRVRVVTARRTSGQDRRVLSQVPSSTDRALPGSVVKLVVADVVVPKPKPQPPAQNCTTGYDPCLTPMSDYDCAGGSGDGPGYVDGPVIISGSDPYELDNDGDGVACED